MRNSLCFNVLNDSNSVLSRCMCVRGRGGGGVLDISTAECVVETFYTPFIYRLSPKSVFIT